MASTPVTAAPPEAKAWRMTNRPDVSQLFVDEREVGGDRVQPAGGEPVRAGDETGRPIMAMKK